MDKGYLDKLKEVCFQIRKDILTIGYKTKSGHLTSALSCTEILVALYFGDILRYDVKDYKWEDRDRFILSKGHACIILYIILAKLGFIPESWLNEFCKAKAVLGAHPKYEQINGIEASTGSLGHGLSFGIGTALAAKMDNKGYMTYVLLGDGECQEGTVWEGALSAGAKHLDNLTVIVDYNKYQASCKVSDTVDLYPLAEKWESFGFSTYEIDGNDINQVVEAFNKEMNGKPKAIIANTIKGKGISFMENKEDWHGRKPNEVEWEIVKKELKLF